MRTTVTIDDRLLARAKAAAVRQQTSVSAVVQDALRAHLGPDVHAEPNQVALPSFGGGGVFLVDILDREALADTLGGNGTP